MAAYKRPGRNFKLELSDMLMMLLICYRSYISQEFLGYLFGIDDSRVCRLIKKIEPLLASTVAIRKDRQLSQEEVESLIIDVMEQPIERPKSRQTKYYSEKKKRHTLKTEIRIISKGRIVHVSRPSPGSVHDLGFINEVVLFIKMLEFLLIRGTNGLINSIKQKNSSTNNLGTAN